MIGIIIAGILLGIIIYIISYYITREINECDLIHVDCRLVDILSTIPVINTLSSILFFLYIFGLGILCIILVPTMSIYDTISRIFERKRKIKLEETIQEKRKRKIKKLL